MKFSFIAKHRGIWPADWMCGALGVSRGGFYAWLKRPRSRRSRSDEVLGAKVRASFIGSDRTYGARRVWHDLLAEGCLRAAPIERLMRAKGLKRARAGVGCRPIWVSGRPPPSLERARSRLRGSGSQPSMDCRLHLYLDGGGLALRGRGDRPVLAPGGRLVDERGDDRSARHRRAGDGDLAARASPMRCCIIRTAAANTPASSSSG